MLIMFEILMQVVNLNYVRTKVNFDFHDLFLFSKHFEINLLRFVCFLGFCNFRICMNFTSIEV